MELSEVIILSAIYVAAFMTTFWCVSIMLKDASIADMVWGFGFIGLAVFLWFVIEEKNILQLLVSVPLAIWGVRLFLHTATRQIGKSEDWRYARMRRKSGGGFFWQSYFKVFLPQGLMMLIIATPLLTAAASSVTPVLSHPTVLGGLALWLVGFFFETVSDIQLRRFKQTAKKDEVLTTGLWSLSRHPNYFGEVLMWWGLALVVLTTEFGFVALISPILLNFMIIKVSGVDMLEKRYVSNKAYQKYKQTTNSIFPGPAKRHM